MAFDRKYGQVELEHGTIGEDEPVVVFRARDVNLPQLLLFYWQVCKNTGSPMRHLDLITESYTEIMNWQISNPDQVKQPDSETSREWLGDDVTGLSNG